MSQVHASREIVARPSVRWSATGAVVGLALLVVGGAVWVPWADSPDRLTPVPPESLFSAAEIARAEAYSGSVRVPALLSLALSVVALVVLAALPWSRRTIGALRSRLPWWLVVVLVVTVVRLVVSLVTVPTDLWVRQLRLDYGLTNQGLGGWLVDRGLGLLTAIVVGSLVAGVVVGTVRALPRTWPVVAGVVLAGLVALGSFVYPVVVEPMFNHFTRLPDGALRTQIMQLADTEGVAVDDVLVADASRRTTTLNAYVSGFGSTRRVVIYDTFLQGVPQDEILAVVAHELAHARHNDVLKGTALGAAGVLTATSLLGLVVALTAGAGGIRRDPVTLVPALLALVAVGSLAVAPVVNAASRAVELRADIDALHATHDPAAFVSMQHRLAVRSLADPTPPWWLHLWFGTHPTATERVALAE